MNKEFRSFKIIGIKILDECANQLRKVLRPDIIYFFCNDYEENSEDSIRLRPGVQELAPDFFSLVDSSSKPRICVTGVVGQNGDGKSSLIEMLIRVFNNFAFMAGFRSDHCDIHFIPDVFAIVFFEVDGVICRLKARGNYFELVVGEQSVWQRDLTVDPPLRKEHKYKKQIKELSKFLFFTIVNNYSLYAYNSEEFRMETQVKDESESWIASLFHKTDAYQTPVVLNPMRDKGSIDINKENELSSQRLSELFLSCEDGKYRISRSEVVEGFAYTISNESKLITRTLKSFILDEKLGARDTIVLNKSFHKWDSRKKYALNLFVETVLNNNLSFWQDFDCSFYSTGLLEFASDVVRDKQQELSEGKKYTPRLTDLYSYLVYLSGLKLRKEWRNVKGSIDEFTHHRGGILSFQQFQRLYLVYEVLLKWRAYLGIDYYIPLNSNPSPKECAVSYLIYKTIRVFETYPEYFSGGIEDYYYPQLFFHDSVRKSRLDKCFRALINDIEKEKTHITLKIRQTLFFLKNVASSPLLTSQTNPVSDDLSKLLKSIGYDYYLDCEEYYSHIKQTADLPGALPPPFCSIDFLISRNSQSFFPLSRMSSGERQLLVTSSSLVYHIKNVNHSKSKGTKITYRNINIILEEVELYFHPEYQRRFIKYLLEQIEYAHLVPEFAINIIMVTHSPFILSDIPRQNVIFLKNGLPDRSMQEDTFGANIHTLLQNGFFLNSVPIGEFAKDKINRMFAILNQSEPISPEDMSILEKEIPLVSEPLLRGQLMKLFAQRKLFSTQAGMTYLKRIEELEREVDRLKKTQNDH